MSLIDFPDLDPGGFPRVWQENQSISGGPAASGFEQTVGGTGGGWLLSTLWRVRTNDDALAFWAFREGMRGKANTTLVPICFGRFANWPVDSYGRVLHPGFTRERSLDGTAYESAEIPTSSVIAATLFGAVTEGSTTAAIKVTQGSSPKAGQFFSILQNLYRITSVNSVSGQTSYVSFLPQLRRDWAAGASVNFARPVCLAHFLTDDQGADFDFPPAGIVKLDFKEARSE